MKWKKITNYDFSKENIYLSICIAIFLQIAHNYNYDLRENISWCVIKYQLILDFSFSFNFTLCKWRNTWSVNHSKIKDISFSLYEEILISLHFFFPQIWWWTLLFEIYINKYTCQNLNYWMNIAYMMPELMLLFEEPSTLSERMIVCSWLITIIILTILWCELYRFWILSDLKNRYGPWFFLQASLFVKIQAKRELEEPMIALEGGFEGWILADSCGRHAR